MTILDELAYTYKRLKRAKEKLEYIEMVASSARISVYSDMPKGCMNVGNPLEDSYIRKEEALKKCQELEARLQDQWQRAALEMNAIHITEQVQKMLYLRFCCGLQWQKCADMLDTEYPNCKWNTSKCFRKYREVSIRLRQR